MLLIKVSNTQSLNLKLNHGLHLDWPALLKSKINFTKVSARKKIHTQKESYERQFKIYRNLTSTLGRQENLITDNALRQQKKPETSMADHKGDNKHVKQI